MIGKIIIRIIYQIQLWISSIVAIENYTEFHSRNLLEKCDQSFY